jgi:very-short-patch-repair endonuclease
MIGRIRQAFPVPQPSRQPAALRRQIFRARDAIQSGLLTAQQLRGPAWQRVCRGVYADATLPLHHGLKARAAALAIPPEAAITGKSAAWLWGVRLASADDLVDVVTPPGHRIGVAAGLRVRTSPLPAADLDELGDVTVTTPLRTAWELALRLEPVEAVVYCDALAALGRVDPAGLTDYLNGRAGQRGCRAAGHVFGLVDGRSESPQESRLRVHLVLAGLPSPVPQHKVEVAGSVIGRVDFAWPQVKVAVEYDGIWHADAEQLIRDRERLNALQSAGWHVHHVTVRDMRDIPKTIAAIRRVLARRGLAV